MDAVSTINKNIDVDKLLRHYDFDKVRNDGDYIRACCKIHGGNNPSAFVISRETGLWFCHTNCGGGDVYTLVQKMEDIDFPSAVRWLAQFYNVDIGNLQIAERQSQHMNELQQFIKLMRKKKKKKTVEPFTINEEIQEVTKYRNFKSETLEHFKLGYVDKVTLKKRNGEDYELYKRLTFPIIQNGIQVGISFRRTRSTDNPKWLHQPVNIETRELLYNYDDVKNEKQIIVVEGITDVWSFYELGLPCVSTFGAHITEEQYKLLLKTGADLIFAFDGDDAGRLANESAIKMFKNKANYSVIKFKEGQDPENVSREELKELYDRRKRYG